MHAISSPHLPNVLQCPIKVELSGEYVWNVTARRSPTFRQIQMGLLTAVVFLRGHLHVFG